MNLPTLKQLRYFVALSEHQHFGRAAAACFISQSAFSVAVRDLESLLGAGLVDRTNKNVTITALGMEVASKARRCLREVEELVELAGEGKEPLSGKLRLGVIPTIAPFLLPRLLPPLRKQYPKLQLYLHEDLTQRLYDKLMAGELDVLLIALPYELAQTVQLSLFNDPFRLAAREGSQLLDPENYQPDLLAPESVLLLADGHCLRDHAISACKLRKPEQLSRFSASSPLTLVEMVDADLGITFLPEMAEGSPLLKSTHIKTWPLDDQSFREIGLVWRRGSSQATAFELLGAFVKKHRA
ncbi:MAG: hydrogen peroxide-inducible genes activator [Ectothiorhodospiraceae bacterium]|nr:hydrogen peroxide-inducible genes activator [Ectothiorhodospiraceae bacterium]